MKRAAMMFLAVAGSWLAPAEARAIAKKAYVYGFPLVGRRWLAAVLWLGFCTAASADDNRSAPQTAQPHRKEAIMILRKIRTALAATIMTLAVAFAASAGAAVIAPAQAGLTATGAD
jgi:hypothetical protein